MKTKLGALLMFTISVALMGMSAGSAFAVITNNNIASNAGIAYSKLKLEGRINKNDIKDSSIRNKHLGNGSVTSSKISDGTIKGEDIADGTITADKLAADVAIGGSGSGELEDGSVSTDKLANGAVTAAKMNSDGCSSGQILKYNGSAWACAADNADSTFGASIDSSEITDGTVVGSDIANGTITPDKLSNENCTSGQVLKYNGSAWACADADNGNLNVRDFGAKGDGVTDDSASIQAAVNYAGSITGSAQFTNTGYGIYFPPGKYLINTTINVPFSGIGFYGPPGRGAKITGNTILFNVGWYADLTKRIGFTEFRNLYLEASATDNATAAIKLYRTTGTLVTNCIIKDFGVHIDSYRGSTTQIIGNRFSNASRTANGTAIVRLQGTDEGAGTYTPGGGMHIVDNEIAGERDDSSGEVNYTEAIFLVHTVDGLYLGRNHMTGYRYALKVEPLATAENHVVTDIISEQEYFDDPSHIAVNPYVVYLTGTAGYAGSMYQDMKFTNDYFRASSLPTLSAGTNALRVSIADAGDFASSGKKVKNFSVLGGTIRQAKDTGVVVAGSGAGKLEVYALAIQNVAFADNNAGGEASTSAMAIEAENVVITGNNFAPDANPSNRLIQLTTSDAASNMPSLIVTDNDFSFSNYAPDAAEIPYNNSPIRYSVNPNARVELSHNLFAGSGKSIDQVYRRKTSNASDVSIYEYSIPRDSNGIIKITLAGSSSDGDDRAAYEWSGMFYRNEGTDSGWSVPINTLSSYSSGGIQASLVTPISDNIIQVRISGADNTDVDWTAHVELLGSH